MLQNLDPETLNLALGIPHRETLNYESLTAALSKRVSPPTSLDEYLCKLEARQHGLTESVRAFADAVATLSIKAYGKTEAVCVFLIILREPHCFMKALRTLTRLFPTWKGEIWPPVSQHVACLHMQRLLL